MFQFSFPASDMRRLCVTLAVATTALHASPSEAQRDQAAGATPASIPVPLKFDSVLASYTPMTDQKLGSWREANDTVARIGGWRAYLKESQTPDAAMPRTTNLPVAPVPVVPSKASPHVGHGAKP